MLWFSQTQDQAHLHRQNLGGIFSSLWTPGMKIWPDTVIHLKKLHCSPALHPIEYGATDKLLYLCLFVSLLLLLLLLLLHHHLSLFSFLFKTNFVTRFCFQLDTQRINTVKHWLKFEIDT